MGDGFYRSKDPTNSIKVLKEATCEVLTTIIGQRASILQCLDRPIENALGLVKFGGNWG